mgnify:FL=1
MNKKKIFNILAIILIAIFCISLSPKTLQNDTFYTIKIGEHIIQNKEIDMVDPFSWHENLEYTYPHWLYDVIIYLIYSIGNMTGIYISTCIFSIILGIAIYKTNTKLAKNQVLSFILTIGSLYLLRDYIAARAQLVSYTLFVLQIFFIEKLIDTKQKRYGVGLLIISILIANLHLAVWPFMFVLYLPYIGEYVIAIIQEKLAKKFNNQTKQGEKITVIKKDGTKLLIIFMIISILCGLLTPLGTTPYTYLIKTMQGNTTQNINEHQPLVLINSTDIICVLIILIAVLTFTNAKIRLNDLFMLGGLIFLMFYSKRQASILSIVGVLALNRLIYNWMVSWLGEDIDDKLVNAFTSKFGAFMISGIIIILSMYFIKGKVKSEYIDAKTYPVNMSDYIIKYFEEKGIDLSTIRLYNEYNYGSYLLYRGIPVFIDSRADLYSPEFNEGVDVFTDFIECSNLSKYFGDTFKKYNITHVILYKNSKVNMIIQKTKLKGYKLLNQDDNFVFYEIEK